MKVPGVKSIVRHEGGSKGGTFKEHAHFHVWFESDVPITNQTVRNRLSKLPEFATHSGQNDWSFRNHDSLENWCAYVIKNSTYTVLLTHEILQKIIQETPKLEDLVVVRKGDTIEHVGAYNETPLASTQVQRKSRAERHKLRESLIDTWHWKVNAQFGIKDYSSAILKCKSRIIDWYSGWLDDRDGIRMIRFLMYTFGDDELREELTFKISRSWDNYV
ncbi:hypothetical protein [Candidatus Magnetobacterium casense]|uniref:Transposase n=1 Tax=Candidatus Magnetobacterium casense TaxID=1455061 RepID=A0ABS6S4P1_9BACT|nr:hypothetical protein [Candidatus Magnetobacterium casensis]MBV6343383.1 hypothetical protein [Candidatus Magnetobacterium casensis]